MRRFLVAVLAVGLVAAACDSDSDSGGGGGDAARSLTIYSGREAELVGPLFERFEEASGITLDVRYGETAELAATILEEGGNSPADLFFGQDAGALGALAKAGRFAELPDDVLSLIDPRFASSQGLWIGTSGRARTVVYNTDVVSEDDLPESILDFADPKWRGKVGWAPTNGSFQAFVTALRKAKGDEVARTWLEDMKANDVQAYPKNTPIVEAVAAGEIEVGFVNHYYLHRVKAESPDVPAENYYLPGGDPGALVNVAGVGVLEGAPHSDEALELVRFLLSSEGQEYFAGAQEDDGFEFPLIEGPAGPPGAPTLADIEQPDVDLSDLDDLEATLKLLQDVGLV